MQCSWFMLGMAVAVLLVVTTVEAKSTGLLNHINGNDHGNKKRKVEVLTGGEEDKSEEESSWDDWSFWNDCSVTCGMGVKTRIRQCRNADGRGCKGKNIQPAVCELQPCSACTDVNRGCEKYKSHCFGHDYTSELIRRICPVTCSTCDELH